MEIHFFATLRQIVGGKYVEVPLPDGASAGDLLETVVVRWPPLREQLLDEHGRLYGHVHMLINGRDVVYLDAGLETPLAADDNVKIFPAVAGGAA